MSWVENWEGELRLHAEKVRECLFGTLEYTATGSKNAVMPHLLWISPSPSYQV